MVTVALKDKEADTVTAAFFDNFTSLLVVPGEIHTDQGKEFDNQVFASLCKKFAIRKSRTTPYRPWSDGLAEVTNKTIMSKLLIAHAESNEAWDLYVTISHLFI